VVLCLRENSSIHGRNQTDWKGDHGGASWNAEHIPLIIAGPGVRHDVSSSYPATLYDVAPTILTLLGVTPQGMDGVSLEDGLSNPDLAQVATQEQRGRQLTPIVQALMLQSSRDGN
jgi:arylsulfatase A-like enzyme